MTTTIDVINRHTTKAPVDIYQIIRDIGIELTWQDLDDGISGWIEPICDDRYKIVINETHASTRQRFTAAHELGHYIFHRDLIGSGVGDSRAYRSIARFSNNAILPIHETQANRVAANILMPRELLADRQHEDVFALAKEFEVSPAAMSIRLGRGNL